MTGVVRISFLNGKNSESVAIDALFFSVLPTEVPGEISLRVAQPVG